MGKFDNFILTRSTFEAIKLLPTDEMKWQAVESIGNYALDEIELTQDAHYAIKMVWGMQKALTDKYHDNYENGSKGGRPTKNPKRGVIEPQKGGYETPKGGLLKSETPLSNDKDKENKKDKDKDAEEDEDKDSAQGTSSASSAKKENFVEGQFLVDNFVKGAWNMLATQCPYMKTVEVIGDTLRAKLNDRYQYLLSTFNGEEARAKNAMIKAIRNIASSDWFAKNKGKATIDWSFGSDDTMMKIINGNYNDDED